MNNLIVQGLFNPNRLITSGLSYGSIVFSGVSALCKHGVFSASSLNQVGTYTYTIPAYLLNRVKRGTAAVTSVPTTVIPQEIHVGDVGLLFIAILQDSLTTAIDVSNCTSLTFLFQKPDNSLLKVPAFFATDGTDGIVQCVVSPGVFDQPGTWRHQAVIGNFGSIEYTTITKFKVFSNL